jgi:hypothetical protein
MYSKSGIINMSTNGSNNITTFENLTIDTTNLEGVIPIVSEIMGMQGGVNDIIIEDILRIVRTLLRTGLQCQQ